MERRFSSDRSVKAGDKIIYRRFRIPSLFNKTAQKTNKLPTDTASPADNPGGL